MPPQISTKYPLWTFPSTVYTFGKTTPSYEPSRFINLESSPAAFKIVQNATPNPYDSSRNSPSKDVLPSSSHNTLYHSNIMLYTLACTSVSRNSAITLY